MRWRPAASTHLLVLNFGALRADAALFGEDASRILISYKPADAARVAGLCAAAGRVGALVYATENAAAAMVKRLPANAAGYARELYAALRDLEDADCNVILIEQVPAGAEWAAIRDRLSRAAAPP